MTLGELRRSLDRPDLSDDLQVTLVINHSGPEGAGFSMAPLTSVMRTTRRAVDVILSGDEQ